MKKLVWTNLIALLALALVVLVPDAEAAPGERERERRSQQHAPVHGHAVGHTVRVLPGDHQRVAVGRTNYYYHAGVYYRPQGVGYVVVAPPLGVRVRALPAGYVSFTIGARRYYNVNATYYLYEPARQEYVVVDEPAGAYQALAGASQSSAGVSPSGALYVYPREGQTEEQAGRDRYECYLWASGESRYDPASTNPEGLRADYDRALSACLDGRGYTVR